MNTADTIEDTVKSILSQDYKYIEYIIMDGGSSDGTLDIINRYRNNISNMISEPDNGIYDAMNKGIKLSSGDIIATLNSDDVYADETIVGRMDQACIYGKTSVLLTFDKGQEILVEPVFVGASLYLFSVDLAGEIRCYDQVDTVRREQR